AVDMRCSPVGGLPVRRAAGRVLLAEGSGHEMDCKRTRRGGTSTLSRGRGGAHTSRVNVSRLLVPKLRLGTGRSRNSVSRPRGRETEFRERAFPNRSLGTRE